MSSSQTQHDEIDLKHNRPKAGEIRRFATGESVFLSPLPVPTGQPPIDLGGSFLEVNDVYLDVGSSNQGKSYQARLCVMMPMFMIIVCLIVAPVLAGFGTFFNPFGRTFWYYFSDFFVFGLWCSLWTGGAAALIGIYAVVSTTRAKARTRPIRFNRQRREVCYFPDGSDKPVIQPWEDTVAWVSVSTGFTGVGVMSTYTFGMAIDDPVGDKVHFLRQGVPTPLHGLAKWEAIRTYMEKGPDFCPGQATHEGSHTFDKEREDMREEYQHKERSILGVGWWYLSHVVTWWRFPYWVAAWDQRYSMKSMPDSIADWSKPLPPEQWATQSPALKQQSADLEKAFAQGQDFMTYFKANLSEAKAEESQNA
ncbi:DUF6708 domain-containing protein [Pseudomonas lijiangensis]|uniref:DUF6708 domain-containing protein n=2 Tax=Pseudomonas lijiangensis TaxID=2995658 RepID=UPI002AFE9DDD|nr:DUF6708 domain-containing protein [Pseudomonas lijiangensis]